MNRTTICAWATALYGAIAVGDAGADVSTEIGRGGLVITSADDEFSLELGGRLHADWSRHGATRDLDPIDGTQIRRARIELNGKLHQHWRWASEFDFAGNEVEIKDVSLGLVLSDTLRLTVGHQKQPFSHSIEMSSNDIPFIERSIDHALIAPFVDRATGIRVDVSSERWFAAAGAFGASNASALPSDTGWGASGRFVYAPVLDDRHVVHLGVRTAYREPDTSGGVLRLRAATTDFSDLSLVDTGALDMVDDVTLYGPEIAAAFGPLLVLGEYNHANLKRSSAGDLEFDSWHVSAAWALGGGSRAQNYDLRQGEFKRLEPASDFSLGSGGGTWELSARYAALDLNDGDTLGGRESTFTVGANWYANFNLRFMLDWTRVIDVNGTNASLHEAEGMNIVSVRAQYAF